MRYVSALILLVWVLFGAGRAYAGTGTGCSGDQWDDHEKGDAQGHHYVYRTRQLWEIGAPGENESGCGDVSRRSKSTKGVSMENRICRFQFTAQTGRLTISSVKGKQCPCAGSFDLKSTCREGE